MPVHQRRPSGVASVETRDTGASEALVQLNRPWFPKRAISRVVAASVPTLHDARGG
jgi:hypothetical protein